MVMNKRTRTAVFSVFAIVLTFRGVHVGIADETSSGVRRPAGGDAEVAHAGPKPPDEGRASKVPSAASKPAKPTDQITGLLPDPEPDDEGPSDPAQILRDYGITAAHFAKFRDGSAVLGARDERELMLRLLLRLRMIPLLNIEHWAKPTKNLAVAAQAPRQFRGRTLYVEGRVVAVKTVNLQEAESMLYELKSFYECHLLVGDPEKPAVVYSREVPKAWKAAEVLDERASFNGIFLKRGPGPQETAPVVFAARRVAWHHGELLLGEMGMDHGLFDLVRHDRPLQPEENEGFYQLLAAMDNTRTRELIKFALFSLNDQRRKWIAEQTVLLETQKRLSAEAETSQEQRAEMDRVKRESLLLELNLKNLDEHRTHSFIPLLRNPAENVGKLRMYRGTALAITPVIIDNEKLKERLGFSKYYQINVMVRLEADLTLTRKGEAGEAAESETVHTHPATLCVRKLPEGMPTGDSIHENIRFAGFFFKKWAYRIRELDENGRPKMRSAPMLIGVEPIWDTGPSPAYSVYAGAIAGGLFVLAVTVIWIGVWRIGRGDKQFQKSVIAKGYDLEEGVSLNDLHLEVTAVDFRDHGKEDGEASTSESTNEDGGKRLASTGGNSNSADQESGVGRS